MLNPRISIRLRFPFNTARTFSTSTRALGLIRISSRNAEKKTENGSISETVEKPRLKINKERLMETLHESCEWGSNRNRDPLEPPTNITRPSLSPDDVKARHWLERELKWIGCDVKMDQIGNMFGRLSCSPANTEPKLPMIAMGGHLDTGGNAGIIGVISALEVLKTVKESGVKTNHDLGIINWMNGGASRFPAPYTGSSVYTSARALHEAYSLHDHTNLHATLKSELDETGNLGTTPASYSQNPITAYFELASRPLNPPSKIGLVRKAHARRWLSFHVNHRDAVLAGAELIQLCHKLGSSGLQLGMVRGGPGNLVFRIELSAPDALAIAAIEAKILDGIDTYLSAGGHKVDVEWGIEGEVGPAEFDDPAGVMMEAAVESIGEGGIQEVKGDVVCDGVWLQRVCPTGIVLVPEMGDGGVDRVDFARGAQVLLDAVLGWDETGGRPREE